MIFRVLDKFFTQIKQVITLITFVFICMSIFLFIYWLLMHARISMPEAINIFVWSVIDFFAQSFKSTPMYKDLIPILPVCACGVFIALTYLCNVIISFLEMNHKRFLNCVEDYKKDLEDTINKKLHNDFLNSLRKTTFMMIKIKVVVNKETSYLSAYIDEEYNVDEVQRSIHKEILSNFVSDKVIHKGIQNESLYFVITDFDHSKDFIVQLVTCSSRVISKYIKPKVTIDFYCGAELYNQPNEFDTAMSVANKLIELKIKNKIVVTPRFKLYFDNMLATKFSFKVEGEYNISCNPDIAKIVSIYSLRRK